MRIFPSALVLPLLCCGPPTPVGERPRVGPRVDGLEIVWHDVDEALSPREEWGPSGREPLHDWIAPDGTTRWELVIESHGGLPWQTGAPDDAWGFPLHFGHTGPFAADGTLHMFECSVDGAVFDVDDYYAFCEPGEAILYLAFPAEAPVDVRGTPQLPGHYQQWWEETIAYSAEREPFTMVEKYVSYGRIDATYPLDVTFEPRARLPEPPWDDRDIERWRVAKFDDR